LACATSTYAQYSPAGWFPGQPASPSPTSTTPAPEHTLDHSQPSPPLGHFVEKILASDPVAKIFSSFGINITDRLATSAKQREELVGFPHPLITDESYPELIVNEKLTEQEEQEQGLVLSHVSPPQSGLSFLIYCYSTVTSGTQMRYRGLLIKLRRRLQ
jgi:hypothetical protein